MKSVLIVAAAAAATALPRPATPVTALAASHGQIAYATSWMRGRCERVVSATASFGPRLCPAVSTGRGIATLELAGARVLWLGYAGGNDRDWTVETATPTRPRPRQLAFVERDVERPAPLLLGPTDGSLLVYAQGTRLVALRANGARTFAWNAPAPITSVSAAGGRVAAGLATGEVDVVAGGAVRQRLEVGGAPDAVAISSSGVVVQIGLQLSRRSGNLAAEYTATLPKGARLEGADAAHALYIADGKAHLVTFAQSGPPDDTVVGSADHAQLDGTRVVLARGRSIVVKQL